jgi:hypothetical protein
MNLKRTIGFGLLIWIIGVNLYALSFYLPILEDEVQQANIWLSIIIIPVVWFCTRLYYAKDVSIHGSWAGLIFFGISAILDALITVPFTIIPYGGSYYDFFIDPGFWLIGIEFVVTTTAYWFIRVKSKRNIANYL